MRQDKQMVRESLATEIKKAEATLNFHRDSLKKEEADYIKFRNELSLHAKETLLKRMLSHARKASSAELLLHYKKTTKTSDLDAIVWECAVRWSDDGSTQEGLLLTKYDSTPDGYKDD